MNKESSTNTECESVCAGTNKSVIFDNITQAAKKCNYEIRRWISENLIFLELPPICHKSPACYL